MNISHTRGFVPIITLLITLGALVILSGAGYGVHKYQMTAKENAELKKQAEAQKISEEQSINENATTSENGAVSVSASSSISKKSSVSVGAKKSITTTLPAESISQNQNVAPVAPVAPVVPPPTPVIVNENENNQQPTTNTTEPQAIIKVNAVRQTSFPDGYGGVYGAYELEINVTAEGGEVLIPESTTNTVGASNVGFSYTISGGTFKGMQESRLSCPTKIEDFCKIKVGPSKNIIATIWLTPDEDGDGNYAVKFGQVTYFINGVKKTFNVNQKTAAINLFY